MRQSRAIQENIVLPGDTNAHDTLFGGLLMKHIDETAAITLHQKTDGPGLSVFGLIKVGRELGAVIPFFRGRNWFEDRDGQSGEAFGELGYLLAFPLQLLRVGEVLILTSPANAEEGALGLDPVG